MVSLMAADEERMRGSGSDATDAHAAAVELSAKTSSTATRSKYSQKDVSAFVSPPTE